jgi:hypothetical protein
MGSAPSATPVVVRFEILLSNDQPAEQRVVKAFLEGRGPAAGLPSARPAGTAEAPAAADLRPWIAGLAAGLLPLPIRRAPGQNAMAAAAGPRNQDAC